jgi:hypothetical protein
MTRLLAFVLCFAAALAAATGEHPKITRADVANMERIVNGQLQSMFPDEPWILLGFARGFYVEGVGVVFSADISLANGPAVTPFSPNPRKELLIAQHEKKQKRLPVLRETMYTIVKNLSNFMVAMPQDEQVVVAISLMRSPWEIGNDIPAQIVMHVQRGKLLEAMTRNTALNTVVKAEEY